MPNTARIRLLLATVCITLATATPAHAALIKQVYRGTVTSGYDKIGLFGAGLDLTGLAYTATYFIDDVKATEIRYTSHDGYGSYYYSKNNLYGGNDYVGLNPISARLTIAGVTISIGGNDAGQSAKYDYNPYYYSGSLDYTHTSLNEYSRKADGSRIGNDALSSYAFTDNATITSSELRTADAYKVLPGKGASSYLRTDYATGDLVSLQFNVTSFASGGVAAVPEPASWALMIGGFGIAGGALRRRAARGTALPATALA